MSLHLWTIIDRFAQSFIPVMGGVLIAWMAFRWTKKKEREHWIRDQNKIEWRELFCAFAEVEKEFLPIYKDEKTADAFAEKWEEMGQRIDFIAMMPFIFIKQKLIDFESDEKWKHFKEEASKDRANMLELIPKVVPDRLYPSMRGNRTQSVSSELQSVYYGLKHEYERIVKAMRVCAEKDLGISNRIGFKLAA